MDPPRRFEDILGQERALTTLRAAIDSGRVHHAWIFSGPKGVGKRTVAQVFARCLLDPSASDRTGSDHDPEVQRLIDAGAHPDLHVITKELAAFADDAGVRSRKQITIPKEVIAKHLLDPIARAAHMPGGIAQKVFIVDEAERMDRSASNAPVQNSILKTLEEPPPGSVIILVTSAEDRLLPTIRSRCQRVVFSRLADDAMNAWLDRRRLDLSAEDLAWVRSFAAGSPGAAEVAASTGLCEWARRLEPLLLEAEAGRFAGNLGGAMHGLIDEWAAERVKENDKASKESANQEAARHLFTLLSERARARLRAAGSESETERAVRTIEAVRDAERHVAASVNLQLAMANLGAKLAGV